MTISPRRILIIYLVFSLLILSFTKDGYCTSIALTHTGSANKLPQNESVSGLSAFFSHGQVFLTWANLTDVKGYYKVYRSTVPITNGSQLAACEYLGWTNHESAKDNDLSHHDSGSVYLVIDSGSAPLTSATGLFVATTLQNGLYYYAVTTIVNGIEDKAIVPGVNSLLSPITETVEEPYPVFQQTRLIDDQAVDIYTTFMSTKYALNQPLINQAGFLANDFALCRSGITSTLQPIVMRFHGGGSDFLDNVTVRSASEINLNPEFFFPSGDNSSWWGANENFDLFNSTNNEIPPTSGINYNFCHQQITHIINWALKHLPIDSNRIYFDGSSLGSIGAYFYAMTYPDRIAAVELSGSVFDLGFEDDYNPICTLNEGNGNRVSGDKQFGTISSNLMTSLGYHTYDILNGGWIMNTFKEQDYPLIYSINGKNDTIVGWTEKTFYYDSVNTSHIGGYYFWDGRKHGGGSGLVWSDENFDIFRYTRNSSFPAFANCSVNEDPGDGHATDGDAFGSVNGFLDWKTDIADDTSYWKAIIYMRDLKKADGTFYPAPASCTVDVTPRRRQQFNPGAGEMLLWNVVHNNVVIQSGQQIYSGGLITIPQVMVYKDSIQLEITTDSTSLTGNVQNNFLIVYPNPFSETALISWQVTQPGKCSVKIYDVQGKLIKVLLDNELTEGIHQISWYGDGLASDKVSTGMYFVRLETVDNSATQKLVVLR